MALSHDIFKIEGSGVLWVEAAGDLASAKKRIEALGAVYPGEYLIHDCSTGEKVRVLPPDSALPEDVASLGLGAALSKIITHAIELAGAD